MRSAEASGPASWRQANLLACDVACRSSSATSKVRASSAVCRGSGGSVSDVDRRALADLQPEDFQQVFDGRLPLVLTGAGPHVNGRLLNLLALADQLVVRCRESVKARRATREEPAFERYHMPDPATPILMAAYTSGGRATYYVSSEDLVDSMDLVGYLALPSVCEENLLEALVPEPLRPRARFAAELTGPGARGFLRRDQVSHCQCRLVLAGQQELLLLAPGTGEVVAAQIGDLGCGVSALDLFASGGPVGAVQPGVGGIWRAQLSPRDALLIPPGWWHQAQTLDKSAVVVSSPYLTEAAAPYALREVQSWLGEAEALAVPESACERLAEVCGRCLEGRRADGRPGTGGWPLPTRLLVPAVEPAAYQPLGEAEPYEARLRRLMEEHPAFVFGGTALPVDAPRWAPEELERFVASRGFLAPACRFPGDLDEEPGHPPFRLRTWLWAPIEQGDFEWRPTGDAPRVIWMYWASGSRSLSGFRRLCVHSWRVQNPDWRLVILDKRSALDYVDAHELPERFAELGYAQQADALRLALLARYGGVYTDVATLCLRPLEEWIWPQVVDQGRGFGAFYLACFGVVPGVSREYVENWFLAARRAHPFMIAWRDLHIAGWKDAHSRFDFAMGPLFRNVDLSYITIAEHREWLTMHICFKKLIDEDAEMQRIWADEMALLRADDSSMAWMGDVDASRCEDSARRWVFSREKKWANNVIATAPMLKFIGDHAQVLQWQPDEHLVARDNCLTRVLAAALPREP